MARTIRSTQEAAGAPAEVIPPGGIAFANNLPNRVFALPSGKSFSFGKQTRLFITDPEQIDFLDKLATHDGTIFRIDPPVTAPEQPAPIVTPTPTVNQVVAKDLAALAQDLSAETPSTPAATT